jgi:hypothetical protein
MSSLNRKAIEAFLLRQYAGLSLGLRTAQQAYRWHQTSQTAGIVAYYYHACSVCRKMLSDAGYTIPDKEADEYGTLAGSEDVA